MNFKLKSGFDFIWQPSKSKYNLSDFNIEINL